ncbi:hypothetical protein BDN71DRAFT_899896 [Pleurotus eryngii]|uniref:Uncharacterized protein n=1 Tax=Pleurotus eryngii TaxID=5323 RepID=A0A9P5ZVW7_PLEER|nr:hypothetical protein BDN71DRAFT_899896 [Pleurotus eryngii]
MRPPCTFCGSLSELKGVEWTPDALLKSLSHYSAATGPIFPYFCDSQATATISYCRTVAFHQASEFLGLASGVDDVWSLALLLPSNCEPFVYIEDVRHSRDDVKENSIRIVKLPNMGLVISWAGLGSLAACAPAACLTSFSAFARPFFFSTVEHFGEFFGFWVLSLENLRFCCHKPAQVVSPFRVSPGSALTPKEAPLDGSFSPLSSW